MNTQAQHSYQKLSKKERKFQTPEELIYLLAIVIMTFSVAMMEKANFGLSMVVAPAFLLSQKIGISFGLAETCFQVLLLFVLSGILRRVKISFFGSFITAVLYGLSLNFFDWLLQTSVPVNSLPLRVLFFILGAIGTPFGVALFFKTYLPACAYDLFVKEWSGYFHKRIGRVKLIYDLSSLALSLVLTFTFFGGLVGIGFATFLCAVINGPIISLCSRWIDRRLDFVTWLPKLKQMM